MMADDLMEVSADFGRVSRENSDIDIDLDDETQSHYDGLDEFMVEDGDFMGDRYTNRDEEEQTIIDEAMADEAQTPQAVTVEMLENLTEDIADFYGDDILIDMEGASENIEVRAVVPEHIVLMPAQQDIGQSPIDDKYSTHNVEPKGIIDSIHPHPTDDSLFEEPKTTYSPSRLPEHLTTGNDLVDPVASARSSAGEYYPAVLDTKVKADDWNRDTTIQPISLSENDETFKECVNEPEIDTSAAIIQNDHDQGDDLNAKLPADEEPNHPGSLIEEDGYEEDFHQPAPSTPTDLQVTHIYSEEAEQESETEDANNNRSTSSTGLNRSSNIPADDLSTQIDVNNKDSSVEDRTIIHPVIVAYQDNLMSLFPPYEAEQDSQVYFLDDETLANGSIQSLLESCRIVLGESIGKEEEQEIQIPSLGLNICETTIDSSTISLIQIIEVYLQLHRNDGCNNPQPLHITLTTKPRLSSRLNYLHAAVTEGKGLSHFIHQGKTQEIEETDKRHEQHTNSISNHSTNHHSKVSVLGDKQITTTSDSAQDPLHREQDTESVSNIVASSQRADDNSRELTSTHGGDVESLKEYKELKVEEKKSVLSDNGETINNAPLTEPNATEYNDIQPEASKNSKEKNKNQQRAADIKGLNSFSKEKSSENVDKEFKNASSSEASSDTAQQHDIDQSDPMYQPDYEDYADYDDNNNHEVDYEDYPDDPGYQDFHSPVIYEDSEEFTNCEVINSEITSEISPTVQRDESGLVDVNERSSHQDPSTSFEPGSIPEPVSPLLTVDEIYESESDGLKILHTQDKSSKASPRPEDEAYQIETSLEGGTGNLESLESDPLGISEAVEDDELIDDLETLEPPTAPSLKHGSRNGTDSLEEAENSTVVPIYLENDEITIEDDEQEATDSSVASLTEGNVEIVQNAVGSAASHVSLKRSRSAEDDRFDQTSDSKEPKRSRSSLDP